LFATPHCCVLCVESNSASGKTQRKKNMKNYRFLCQKISKNLQHFERIEEYVMIDKRKEKSILYEKLQGFNNQQYWIVKKTNFPPTFSSS
jgi:hypothetical protein